MNLLSYDQLLEIHRQTLILHGGLPGVKDEGFLLSALDQPAMSFGGEDLYPSWPEKTAALGFSLAKNHAFHDGNKRVAFAAMTVFLAMNGFLLEVPEPEVVDFMLKLAAGQIGRDDLVSWLQTHIKPLSSDADLVELQEPQRPSEEAWRIEAERSPYWKVKMMCQVLSESIERCAPVRLEHQKGFSSAATISVSRHQVFDWMSAKFNEVRAIVDRQEKAINFLGREAFVPSDSGGNLDFMVGLGQELGQIYSEMLFWSQTFRRLDLPEEFGPFLDTVANYSDALLSRIEALPPYLLLELQKAEAQTDGTPYVINIVVDFTPTESDSLERGLGELAARLGLSDSNGLSSTDHVTRIVEIAGLETKAMVSHSKECSRWVNALSSLDNKPTSIRIPQLKALNSSCAQTNIKLDLALKKSIPELHLLLSELKKYAPSFLQLSHRETSEAIHSSQESQQAFIQIVELIEEQKGAFSIIRENVEKARETFDSTSRVEETSIELFKTLNTREDLAQQWDQQLQSMITALDSE